MVAHNMHLRRPPPPPNCVPPTGLKVWSDELDPKAKTGSSSSDGKPGAEKPFSWRDKQRRVVIGKDGEAVYSIGTFIAAAGGAWLLVLVLFLLWWRPHVYLTGGATGGAFFVGLLLSYLYYANLRKKEQCQQVVSGHDCVLKKACNKRLGEMRRGLVHSGGAFFVGLLLQWMSTSTMPT
jgi:hypothetical protein